MRTTPRASDLDAIERLLRDTALFRPDEVAIAREVVEEGLLRPAETTYRYRFLDDEDGELIGFAAFGPVPCTVSSWDLYWIAVRPERQGGGVGRRILAVAEADAAELGATRMYVDTSGRADYAPTRGFYEARGYEVAARFPDFYAPGDAKVVFVKVISA